VTPEELQDTRDRIISINKMVEIIETKMSVVDLDKILNIRAFDLTKLIDLDPDFLVRDFVTEDHEHGEKHDHDHKEKKHDHPEKSHKKHTKHEHDFNVTSVGIIMEGDLLMHKLNQWMGGLLREKGIDIYRMKGVLSVHGMDTRFVFQGVHMIFNGNPAQPWGTEKRINKIVFIGKKLNRTELEEGLRSCLVNSA